MKKRIFALMLTLCMVFGMANVTAYAADGSYDEPYMFAYMGEAVEITVPAGTTNYYMFNNRLDGQIVVVSGSWDVQIQYGMFPVGPMPNGTIEFELSTLMSDKFAVINTNQEEAITVTLDLKQAEVGTRDNPAVLEDGYVTAEIAAGSQGYFFTYTAAEDGVLAFSVQGALGANWKELDWTYSVQNTTASYYGDTHYSTDEIVVSTEYVKVSAGDEIGIMVNTYDANNEWTAPEGTIDVQTVLFAGDNSDENPLQIMGNGFVQKIQAGKSFVYSGRVGGKVLAIANENIKVIYNNKECVANEEGVVEVALEGDGSYFAPPVVFEIVNISEEDVTIEAEFALPVGSQGNPEKLEGDFAPVNAEITEGNQMGYFIEYVVPGNGKVSIDFYAYNSSDDSFVELGWSYVVNNVTAGKYGDLCTSADEVVVNPYELEVSEGDVLEINVSTFDPENPYSAPAGNVMVNINFEYPAGTEGNPVVIEDEKSEQKVSAESVIWYATYHFGTTMTIIGTDGFVVVYGEDEYQPVDGVVNIEISAPTTIGMREPAKFAIKNLGTEEATYEVEFAYPVGSITNPEKVELDKEYTVELEYEAWNAAGYYYTYTVVEDGKLTISVDSKDSGWQYYVNIDRADYYYGDTHWSNDEVVVSSETVEVKAGDIVRIWVCTFDPEDEFSQQEGSVVTKVTVAAEDPEGSDTPESPEGSDTPESPEGSDTPESPEGSDTPENPEGSDTPENPEGSNTPEDPDTDDEIGKLGDNTNIGLWIAILGIGVVAVAGSIVLKRKSK